MEQPRDEHRASWGEQGVRIGDQREGAHLRTHECAPKARTQKKCLTL